MIFLYNSLASVSTSHCLNNTLFSSKLHHFPDLQGLWYTGSIGGAGELASSGPHNGISRIHHDLEELYHVPSGETTQCVQTTRHFHSDDVSNTKQICLELRKRTY